MPATPWDVQSEPPTGLAEQTACSQAGADPSHIHVFAADRVDTASAVSSGQDDRPAREIRLDGDPGRIMTGSTARLGQIFNKVRPSVTVRSCSTGGALIVAFGLGWACASIFTSDPDARLIPTGQRAELSPGRFDPEKDVRRHHRVASAPHHPAPMEPSRLKAPASVASARPIASVVAQRQAEPQTTSSIGPQPASSESNPPPPPLSPVPETRPATIAGWSVRDVDGDRATLVGPDHVWTVRTGDTVPGVGRIDTIVRWGSRWIVATTAGLISTE